MKNYKKKEMVVDLNDSIIIIIMQYVITGIYCFCSF